MSNEYLVYAWQIQSSKQASSVSIVGELIFKSLANSMQNNIRVGYKIL